MADSVVVADNVELVANNIQSKVGATLLGTKAMAENTTGGSESSFKILEQVKDLQQATVDKVHAVWEILKSQLDIEKDEARRIRCLINKLVVEENIFSAKITRIIFF